MFIYKTEEYHFLLFGNLNFEKQVFIYVSRWQRLFYCNDKFKVLY